MALQRIKKNTVVRIDWTISDSEGVVLEQTDVPVTYLHGSAQQALLDPVERALEGHTAGDSVKVVVPPEQGFGLHDSNLVFTDLLKNVPSKYAYLGAEVKMQSATGEVRVFRVTKIADGEWIADANHPFAGTVLTFVVKIRDVRDPSKEERVQRSAGNPTSLMH